MVTSFIAVCLSLAGMIVPLPSVADQSDPVTLSEVALSPELAALTKEIDFVYFVNPYQLNIGEQLQMVFTGTADAPYKLELVKCEIFHRSGDSSMPNPCAQVDCRIKVSLTDTNGSRTLLEGRGVEIFDVRSPYDVVREALGEAIESLAGKVKAKI